MSDWQSKKIKSANNGFRRSKIRSKNNSSSIPWSNVGKWIGGAFGLVVLFYIFSYLLPRVDITVIPESRGVTFKEAVTISLNNNTDVSGAVLSGEKVFRTGSVKETFKTTGEKDIGEKAKGSVVFFNYTGLSHPVMVEDGLETFDGKFYTITNPLTIPAASVSPEGDIVPGSISAEVIALEPGEEHNIGPQKLFIESVSPDKQLKIYAEAQNSLSGGTSEIVKVISDEDISSAQEQLRQMLVDDLLVELSDDLPDEETYMRETFELVDEVFSAEVAVNQEADDFSYELSAQGEVIIYKNQDLNNLIKEQLASKLNPGEVFLSESPSSVESISVTVDPLGNTVLTLQAVWDVSQPLDIDVFKEQILGKREADARRIILQNDSVADVRFDWNLAINRRVPNVSTHVNLHVGLSE